MSAIRTDKTASAGATDLVAAWPDAVDDEPPGAFFRWGQLGFAMACMAVVGNLQYGWTQFVEPLADRFGWSHAAIQAAFAVFVVAQTWCVPVAGYAFDRLGARPVVLAGGLLCAVGWVMNSVIHSPQLLYVAAAITGAGAGAVYGTCVGGALKWFPDRRGLAVGLVVACFGAGSTLTLAPTSMLIASRGYDAAFLYLGLGQGLLVMLLALGLEEPRRLGAAADAPAPPATVPQARRDYAPLQMLREPVFWVMYAIFVLVAAGGLVATAQIATIARDFRIDRVPLTVLGLALPAVTFALAVGRVCNGLSRLVFGWVSDRIGREETMVLAFLLECGAVVALAGMGQHPWAFALLTGALFFAWGEIYSLFPSTCADTFGSRHAAANAGLLYTAKGVAAVAVPLSSAAVAITGEWHTVFMAAAGMNFAAALLAWFLLRPMRQRLLRQP